MDESRQGRGHQSRVTTDTERQAPMDQAPNSKHQMTNKFQAPKAKHLSFPSNFAFQRWHCRMDVTGGRDETDPEA
jgi:hypothetical protein